MIWKFSKSNKPATALTVLMNLLNHLTNFSLLLSSFSLFILLFAYVYEVLMRYFFNAPTSWTYDMSTWLLCTMIMLALPAVTREKGNIAITFFLEKTSTSFQRSFSKILSFVSFSICLVCAWICFTETISQFEQGIETIWNNPVPKWLVSVAIPFGFLFSGIHFFTFCFNSNQEKLK